MVGKDKPAVVPDWASDFIKDGDLEAISQAIFEAEKKTQGEIVPMIVRSSSTGFLAPWVGALVWLVFLLFLESLAPQFFSGFDRVWILPTAFLAGMLVLRRPRVRLMLHRYLTHPYDRHSQVLARAELEFHRGRYERTTEHSSILIFVSLLEKDVVVLADEGVAQRVPSETWRQVVQEMVLSLKSNQVAAGWVKAIHKAGEILSENFPAEGHQINQIANQLVFKE